MSENKEISDNEYAILGQFITRANGIEFFVNTTLERITLNIGEKATETSQEINYSLDEIHKQSIRARVSNIILFLSAGTQDSDTKKAISFFKNFYRVYNKEIRNVRDFVAHNPLMMVENNARVINSRRHKSDNPIESLDIEDLLTANQLMKDLMSDSEVTDIMRIVSQKFPTSKPMLKQLTRPPISGTKGKAGAKK